MALLLYALARCAGRIASRFATVPGQSSMRTRNWALDVSGLVKANRVDMMAGSRRHICWRMWDKRNPITATVRTRAFNWEDSIPLFEPLFDYVSPRVSFSLFVRNMQNYLVVCRCRTTTVWSWLSPSGHCDTKSHKAKHGSAFGHWCESRRGWGPEAA